MTVSIYCHIPFCARKCPYCHFYVVPNRTVYHQALEEGLALEWNQRESLLARQEIASIYFGGGTPSLFPKGIGSLLEKIKKSCSLAPDSEITVEANPTEGSIQLYETLRSFGVNRLSFGVQSLDDRSLLTLEREHSAKEAYDAVISARTAGFENISIDLMYDLPDQTESSWQTTLDRLEELPITHLSLYNLTVEPHTPFSRRNMQLRQPNSTLSLKLLEQAVKKLESLHLKRYEISAFAIPGFESRHNLGYWTGRPFLGFGPSAHSFWEGDRFSNLSSLQRYTSALKRGDSTVDFREKLPFLKSFNELFAVRLRLLEGAPNEELPPTLQQSVDRLTDQGLLRATKTRIQLTEKGLLFYDTVASELI